MSFTKLLRVIILGLISVLALAILAGIVTWWHDWWYGTLNPHKVQPTEDWTLGLGFSMLVIQLATAVETFLIALVTRLRWINFNRGRNALGLFSLLMLTFALPGFRGLTSVTPEAMGATLLYLLYLILPTLPAWGLLYFRKKHFRDV
ncbi:MAG: hypothetical protein AAGA83_04390 [Cyanobacteria bacterium P01_F01_bin.116]